MERGNSKHGPRLDEQMAREVRGLVPEEAVARSELGRYIPMSALPGDREDLLAAADEMDAPDHVLAELRRLPDEQVYEEQRW